MNSVATAFSTMFPKKEAQLPSWASIPSVVPNKVVAAAPAERKIELYSTEYYITCGLGGVASCGLTHTAVTPLDVVKCNMQTNAAKFPSIGTGFSVIVKEQGLAGLFKGWVPTLYGYSAQGAFKFGLYEYFKKTYADMAGPEMGKKYQSVIFLAGSASAEFFADIALCPFEAVKVKVQTIPGFAKGISDGLPKIISTEGVSGLFKGVAPLWGRQIPYTMMKFGAFENTVVALYKYVVPKPKSECSKGEQLGVSFGAGYIAGVLCAAVSQPADNLVSKLNATKGATVGDIVKEMGIYGLCTRGLPLRIVMVGTLTGLQWGIYDAFKVAFGLPTTGATEEKKK
uniref:Mitochondrial phosphate carrier protein n=1 Tax=Polytomella parva TaxID=51329 RepID=A0A7S0V9K2_9CHLO|mmetsp:Transcript_33538/g.60576  ORF Transcript_33538/g.60576 Transcript_33538/m.60576 type:complete len:341 (+) Transcript_33538:58-1080(+)